MSTDLKPIDNKLPAYLTDTKTAIPTDSTEEIGAHLRPPFLKIVEALTEKSIKEQFGEGAVYTSNGELVCPAGGSFTFTPILFFAEYWKTNKKGVDPFIIERTTDDRSALAAKCENPQYWKIVENGAEVQHSKVLQFLIMVPGFDVPLSLSFLRGRFKDGQNFLAKIQMRKLGDGKTAPLFANVFECFPVTSPNSKKGDYHTFDVRNPSKISQWVQDAERYNTFMHAWQMAKEAKERGELEVQLDSDVELVDAPASTPI